MSTILNSNLLPKVEGNRQANQLKDIEQVAKDFETIFLEMMLKSMRDTARPEEESNALNIFQGMLDSEYAKQMSQGQSFGVREMIIDWVKRVDPEITSDTKHFHTEINHLKNTKA
ncbi:MAG: rod-binding protein, partial [Silvanigrellaceae bacterium]|nr:rod-binding protein [Silvanigrellaceae bacterium]